MKSQRDALVEVRKPTTVSTEMQTARTALKKKPLVEAYTASCQNLREAAVLGTPDPSSANARPGVPELGREKFCDLGIGKFVRDTTRNA